MARQNLPAIAGKTVVIADPYLSRPVDPKLPLVPDAAAIAAHTRRRTPIS